MARERYDACVVGLGAVGCQVALHLARRGLRVAGLDRFRPPHGLGSSHGRTRIIREAYFEHPLYVPIVQRAYELWRELEHDAGRALLQVTGGLMVGPPDGAIVAGARASADEHGLPYDLLAAAEVRSRFPAFRARDGEVGLLEPRAGVLAAEACVEAALAQALRAGATLHLDEPVLSWESASAVVLVRTATHTIETDALVLAAGPWIGELAGRLDVPLTVTRQPLLWLEPVRPALFGPARLPIFAWEWLPGRCVYGFPDTGDGFKVAEHGGGEQTTADGVDRTLRDADVDGLREMLAACIPDGNGPVRDGAVCLYTSTPDGHPLLDRHPEDPRVVVASPCSGHGFKFAPTVGEAIADLVTGAPGRFDLSPFRLGRPLPA